MPDPVWGKEFIDWRLESLPDARFEILTQITTSEQTDISLQL